jgi:hypothetical protein
VLEERMSMIASVVHGGTRSWTETIDFVNKGLLGSDTAWGGCRTEHHSETLSGARFKETGVLCRTCHDQNGKPTKILIPTGVPAHRPMPPNDGCADRMLIVTSTIGWRHSADGAETS